ncbi:MAG TPA: DinB family protein [Bryobacteraceae bacterium]|nr:DinB family protein [Bryobacteraceae bacterium]
MIASEAASELDQVLESSSARLLSIGEESAGKRPAPESWCKKEILGHLIDSASNNHQRFVRLQLEETLVLPSYQQNGWVQSQNYAGRRWRDLVELWLAYNRHLVHVIRNADASAARHVWKGPGGDTDLEFLIGDYLKHLRHHLEQILEG